jgi:hypothetical protein
MDAEVFAMAAMIGILLCWVLLPLIPAVLIYSLFPSTTVAVSGPFANLTVKASGAFAAYLIVFAAVFTWLENAYYFVGSSLRPTWTISGNLNVIGKNGKRIEPPSDFFQKICIKTDPDFNTFKSSSFTIMLPELPNGIPKIYFETSYGQTLPIQLDTLKSANVNRFRKLVKVVETIEIRQKAETDSGDGLAQVMPANSVTTSR